MFILGSMISECPHISEWASDEFYATKTLRCVKKLIINLQLLAYTKQKENERESEKRKKERKKKYSGEWYTIYSQGLLVR